LFVGLSGLSGAAGWGRTDSLDTWLGVSGLEGEGTFLRSLCLSASGWLLESGWPAKLPV
jgi:hypothetical protein